MVRHHSERGDKDIDKSKRGRNSDNDDRTVTTKLIVVGQGGDGDV